MKLTKSTLEVKPDKALAKEVEKDLEEEDKSLAGILPSDSEDETENNRK